MQNFLPFPSALFRQTVVFIVTVALSLLLMKQAKAQAQDLTVVVLLNSTNATDYNTSPASPGVFRNAWSATSFIYRCRIGLWTSVRLQRRI